MAVETIVSVVIQKLTDMLEEPLGFENKIRGPVGFEKEIKQVEEMRGKLTRLQHYFINVEETQGDNDEVEKWVLKYLSNLYELEDIVETFVLRIARRRGIIASNTRVGAFFNNSVAFFFFFDNLKACQKLRWRMARIGAKIDRLNKSIPKGVRDVSSKYNPPLKVEESSARRDEYQAADEQKGIELDKAKVEEEEEEEGEISGVEKTSLGGAMWADLLRQTTLPSSSSYEKESGIVGIEDDVKTLVTRLTGMADKSKGIGSPSHNNIISIVGAVGSGKTTLAKEIFKNKIIKNHFKCRAWVSDFKDYTKEDLLRSLLKQVGSPKDIDTLEPDEVFDILPTERYLVIIDDVHNWDLLDKLTGAIRQNGDFGSKVIITTCDEKAAQLAGPNPHCLNGLSDEKSWELFLKKAGFQETAKAPELERKVLELCGCLPLRITLLGGLLSTKEVSEWSGVLDHISKNNVDIVTFCYNVTPLYPKLCLLYLVLFPKDFEIPVRRLVRLWLAEGFLERCRTKIPEDVAQENFEDLVKRNIIQITKWRSNGSHKKCRLPSALYDYLQPKTIDIGLFHVRNQSPFETGKLGLRRIVEYQNVKTDYCVNSKKLSYLRSYISFNLQKKDIPAREVAEFVGKIIGSKGFSLLRVLDLEKVYKPSLPDKLDCLFHLRYLGLRWTFLENLPPSVGDLLNLETLDLKRTCINSLPNSIWKLERLRHLNLNEIRLYMPAHQRCHHLSKLLTLWGLFLDDKSLVTNGLDRLRDIRELGITFNLNPISRNDLAVWISKLTHLESLRLRSKDDIGRPSQLHLEPLSALNKLSNVHLLGQLDKLPEFPRGLKVLALSVSHLKTDPMPTLGQLPSLTHLRLLANSYKGKRIVCPTAGFQKLKVLKLWMLGELEEWVVEEKAMENLREIDIRCCNKLTTLPPTLLQLSTLEKLTLTMMPEKFVADVKREIPDHISLIVNDDPKEWDFSPLPWEQDKLENVAESG